MFPGLATLPSKKKILLTIPLHFFVECLPHSCRGRGSSTISGAGTGMVQSSCDLTALVEFLSNI